MSAGAVVEVSHAESSTALVGSDSNSSFLLSYEQRPNKSDFSSGEVRFGMEEWEELRNRVVMRRVTDISGYNRPEAPRLPRPMITGRVFSFRDTWKRRGRCKNKRYRLDPQNNDHYTL